MPSSQSHQRSYSLRSYFWDITTSEINEIGCVLHICQFQDDITVFLFFTRTPDLLLGNN